MHPACHWLFVTFCCVAAAQQINSTSQGTMKASKQVTLVGCLSGPNHEGVYVLETGSGTVDVGGLSGLNNHAGHRVKLTGHWAKNGAEIGERDPSENKATEHQDREEDVNEKWFKVSKIRMLSKTCSPK